MTVVSSWHTSSAVGTADKTFTNGFDLSEVVEILYRRRMMVAASILAGLVAGIVMHGMLPAAYVSKASVLIDPRGLQIMDKDLTARPSTSDQSLSLVESEMRVISSDSVLRRVIAEQRLTEDSDFNSAKPGVIATALRAVRALFGFEEDNRAATISAETRTLMALQKAVKVRREPQSFVVELSVSTKNAAKSQAIATSILAAYTQSQHQTMAQATQRAAQSLNERLSELRQRLERAEQAVEAYRARNGIVTTQVQGQQARLLDEQAIAEFTTQLVGARAEIGRATARLDMMNRAQRSPDEIAAMPEAVLSPAMVFLRNQHSTQRQRMAALSASVLPAHPAMRNARQELQGIERGMRQELALMVSSAQLELERARDNERQLEARLDGLKSSVSTTNGRMIKLRELEREAEAERAVFASFLNRARELSEQQSVDSRFAVVISPAVAPTTPSSFPMSAMLVLGLLAGAAAGVGRALWTDLAGPVLRGPRRFAALAETSEPLVIAGTPRGDHDIAGRILAEPCSPYATSIIELGTALSSAGSLKPGSTIVFTSAQPGTSKSDVALNFALAQAASGARVLLVDADLAGRAITRHFEAEAMAGISDELAGTEAPWLSERSTGLAILASGTAGKSGSGHATAKHVQDWVAQNAPGSTSSSSMHLQPPSTGRRTPGSLRLMRRSWSCTTA